MAEFKYTTTANGFKCHAYTKMVIIFLGKQTWGGYKFFSKPTVLLIKSTVGGSLYRSEKARVSVASLWRRGSGKHGLFHLMSRVHAKFNPWTAARRKVVCLLGEFEYKFLKHTSSH